jgi:aspartyl-tRNA(Asn)/glutamyl-tRNA(Gln) amidotransferase subunit C
MSESKNQLSKEEVLHLAKLARLDLTDLEVEKFKGELESILRYLDKLRALPVVASQVEQSAVTATVGREDLVVITPQPEDLITQAPAQKAGLLEVPKVFGD